MKCRDCAYWDDGHCDELDCKTDGEWEDCKAGEPVVLDMDGTRHTDHETTGCCNASGKKCGCGGWMHFQGVYGGCFYQCEKCKRKE